MHIFSDIVVEPGGLELRTLEDCPPSLLSFGEEAKARDEDSAVEEEFVLDGIQLIKCGTFAVHEVQD